MFFSLSRAACVALSSSLLLSCLSADAAEPKTALPAKVTFSEHIAPLVFNNCYECHRPGEPTPFTLMSFQDVSKRASMLLDVMESRYMPPWHPTPGDVEFRHSRRLKDDQIALFSKWVETGKAEGKTELPQLPKYQDGWRLGKPDLIASMERGFAVPADGNDIYRNFVVEIDLPEDKWLTAIDFQAEGSPVIHHILYYADNTGAARKLNGPPNNPGFGRDMRRPGKQVGGWAVGGPPSRLPYGLAVPMPKGSDLILACHFHPVGKAEVVKVTAGLYFADKAPERMITTQQVPTAYGSRTELRQRGNGEGGIPAGATDFRIDGKLVLQDDYELIRVSGHAHYLCKWMKATAELEDGTELTLLDLPAWDFNWQTSYTLKEKRLLPKGTVLRGELSYDNSDGNPSNPSDPPVNVFWGLESTDEMGSLFFTLVPVKASTLTKKNSDDANGNERVGKFVAYLYEKDKNRDGKLQKSEVTGRSARLFSLIDQNKDDEIDKNELKSAGPLLSRILESIEGRE